MCNGGPADKSARPQILAMSRRVRDAWRNKPGGAEALRIAGAEGLAALVNMRRAGEHPAMRAWLAARGAK